MLIWAFGLSMAVTLWVVYTSHHHAHLSGDGDLSGPQKFHQGVIPRVGGLGIYVGMLLPLVWQVFKGHDAGRVGLLLLLCALPAFLAGLIEDFTKRVSPAKRLLATAVSAVLACCLLDATLSETDIPGLDWLMALPAVAVAATVLAVSGVANAVNIIDGFNGLASMCVALMLACLAAVAHFAGDTVVVQLSLMACAAVGGFFIWNYPRGLIFLGDGGAYFLGFLVAELGILLVVRNPEVSPLVALLVCIYPVFETLFSIYRRRFLRAVPPGLPDGIHLHSLIYRRIVRWAAGPRDSRGMTARNSAVAPFLWMLCMGSLVPALLFWDDSGLIGLNLLLFGLIYVYLYGRIVRFRTPTLVRKTRRIMNVMAGASLHRQSMHD